MAEIEKDEAEYFADFIRIDGKRGTVLIFDHGEQDELAKEIADIIDKEGTKS